MITAAKTLGSPESTVLPCAHRQSDTTNSSGTSSHSTAAPARALTFVRLPDGESTRSSGDGKNHRPGVGWPRDERLGRAQIEVSKRRAHLAFNCWRAPERS